ncbi:MAG: spore coat U domain-containing protein [Acinetobacter sp.]
MQLQAAPLSNARFSIRVVINESCNISSRQASDINFGRINRSAKAHSAQGTLDVMCTDGTPYNISLLGHGAMSNQNATNTETIPYTLYQDASLSKEWNSVNTYTNTGSGKVQKIHIWGEINNGSTNVAAGQYTDTVTATISY